MSDYISRNAITRVLNTMDRYVADELTLCDTEKKFPRNEVFIVDDVYEEIVEQLSPADVRENRWIPVSERLPKIADVYRVTRYYPNNVVNPIYLVDACCFDGFNTWYDDNRINHERAYADNVIAWQENPEPTPHVPFARVFLQLHIT